MAEQRQYIAIDLKSFYASVECVDRGLDPLKENLVVADASRTDKTICLAVSPPLKKYGIPGRARLFEVKEAVRRINAARKIKAPGCVFRGRSTNETELENDPSLELDFIIAPPRMARYMDVSTGIFGIYMNYVAPKDMHVYSVDEVFIDATQYLRAAGVGARRFASEMIADVLSSTGITATAGIGTNLYLSKVAMDIVAKHIPADENGVRIAELDELSYRRLLWDHRPITDFWRVGHGYAKRLEGIGIYTMGDVARCSLVKSGKYFSEEKLYKEFGINAELLIDHAWGWEPCTIEDIKSYKPQTHSLSSGQVLPRPYRFDEARVVIREMADSLVLDLVEKELVTDQIALSVGYDTESISRGGYGGQIKTDHYGRSVPKDAHGSVNLGKKTSSTKLIEEKLTELFERIVDRGLLIRRMCIAANRIVEKDSVLAEPEYEQLDLFTDYRELEKKRAEEAAFFAEENKLQHAIIAIKNKYGKNALLRGMNFLDGATARDRNSRIGGHRA